MLLVATGLKLVAEIALMAMAGRFVLGLLVGAQRERNLFYGLLKVLTEPFVKLARRCLPRAAGERYAPPVAAALLAGVWLGATAWRIVLCLQIGVQACR